MQKYFDQCFDWEVSSNSTCTAPTNGTKIPNGEYGHPCKNGSFDVSKCVFRACSQGYYLSSDHRTCVVSPTYSYSIVFTQDFLTAMIIVTAVSATILISIPLLIIFCCYCSRRRKQKLLNKEDHGTYTPLSETLEVE